MLESVAKTYRCPFTNTTTCLGIACLGWKSVAENPVEGYCHFVGDLVRVVPELTVQLNNKTFTSGDSYDFGSKVVDTISFIEIKLSNTGTGILKFTATPKVTMTGDTSDFSFAKVVDILQEETAPDGVQILKIRFKPASTGAKSITISITSNDLDNTPFTLDFTGTGI